MLAFIFASALAARVLSTLARASAACTRFARCSTDASASCRENQIGVSTSVGVPAAGGMRAHSHEKNDEEYTIQK